MDLLVRVAERRGIPVVRIANRNIPLYGSPLVSAVRVGADFERSGPLHRGARHHGRSGGPQQTCPWQPRSWRAARLRLAREARNSTRRTRERSSPMRDLMRDLRAAGAVQGGPPAPGPAERRRFTDALDRLLTRLAARP